jgi:hypothetical protein
VIETSSPTSNGSPNFAGLVERLDDLESQARAYARNALRSTDDEDFQIELGALKRRVSNAETSEAAHPAKLTSTLERRLARLETGDQTSQDKHGEAGGGSARVLELEKRMERVETGGSDEAFELDEHAFPTFSDFSDTVLKARSRPQVCIGTFSAPS